MNQYSPVYMKLEQICNEYHQQHLFEQYEKLDNEKKKAFLEQASTIDFKTVDNVVYN